MAVITEWQQAIGVSVRKDVVLSNLSAVHASAASYDHVNGYLTSAGTKHFVAATGHRGIPAGTGLKANEVYGVLATNKPVFSPGVQIENAQKMTGQPVAVGGTGYNFRPGIVEPTTAVEFEVDRATILPFLFGTFQRGSVAAETCTTGSATTDFIHSFILPASTVSPEAQYFLTMAKALDQDGDGVHQLISDCVCSKMTLSSTEGEGLKASFDLMGHAFAPSVNTTSITDAELALPFKFPEIDPYLWHNSVVLLKHATDAHCVVEADGFELTVTADVSPIRYNSRYPRRFVYNGYTVEGKLRIPWSAATVGGAEPFVKMLSSTTTVTPYQINILWLGNSALRSTYTPGTLVTDATLAQLVDLDNAITDTTGDLAITIGAVFTDVADESDGETCLVLSFTGASIMASNAISAQAIRVNVRAAETIGLRSETKRKQM